MRCKIVLFLVLLAGYCLPAASAEIALNARQQQWLKDHPKIVWAPEADYQPFIFVDAQGQPRGLSRDLLALLNERLHLGLVAAPAAQLQDLLDAVQREEVDLLTSLRPTEERARLLDFTSAYVYVPTVLVLPSDTSPATGLQQLAGKPVAVSKGYAVEAYVRKHYPDIQWQALPSDAESLTALRAGKVSAALMDLGSASYLLGKPTTAGLSIGPRISFDYPLSFAYRKDWPELGEILEVGLRSVTPQEQAAISKQWLGQLPSNPTLPGSQLLSAIALSALVAALLLLLAYQRRRAGKTPV